MQGEPERWTLLDFAEFTAKAGVPTAKNFLFFFDIWRLTKQMKSRDGSWMVVIFSSSPPNQ
jgi:hypothetical protein